MCGGALKIREETLRCVMVHQGVPSAALRLNSAALFVSRFHRLTASSGAKAFFRASFRLLIKPLLPFYIAIASSPH